MSSAGTLEENYQKVKEAYERISKGAKSSRDVADSSSGSSTGYVHKTAVLTCSTIDRLCGNSVRLFFKAENFQKIGAFKPRGAFNALLQLTPEEKERGVITHSSGLIAHERGIEMEGGREEGR